MSQIINGLLKQIKVSRSRILEQISDLSYEEGVMKIGPESWNIQEVIEHLVLAERGGFDLIYTAAEKFRMGEPVWMGKSENDGLPIEEIINITWKTKEKAPASATPDGKWSLGVWISHFKNCDDLLQNLNAVLAGLPFTEIIYPHFLCGPLNALQRLEFIRYHMDRHYIQIDNIKKALRP